MSKTKDAKEKWKNKKITILAKLEKYCKVVENNINEYIGGGIPTHSETIEYLEGKRMMCRQVINFIKGLECLDEKIEYEQMRRRDKDFMERDGK